MARAGLVEQGGLGCDQGDRVTLRTQQGRQRLGSLERRIGHEDPDGPVADQVGPHRRQQGALESAQIGVLGCGDSGRGGLLDGVSGLFQS